MARLPVLHRRRSKAQRALDLAKGVAKVWTGVKVSSAGARVAKQGARFASRRPRLKLVVAPVAAAGGVLVWRATHKGHDGREPDIDRPLGPVASADTVSPPADAAAQAAHSEAQTAS
jgi:hypothetical protein